MRINKIILISRVWYFLKSQSKLNNYIVYLPIISINWFCFFILIFINFYLLLNVSQFYSFQKELVNNSCFSSRRFFQVIRVSQPNIPNWMATASVSGILVKYRKRLTLQNFTIVSFCWKILGISEYEPVNFEMLC